MDRSLPCKCMMCTTTLTWGVQKVVRVSTFLQCYPAFRMDTNNAPHCHKISGAVYFRTFKRISHWMVCRLNFLGVKGVKVYGCWNFLSGFGSELRHARNGTKQSCTKS